MASLVFVYRTQLVPAIFGGSVATRVGFWVSLPGNYLKLKHRLILVHAQLEKLTR